MSDVTIGIDIGTSSVKALAVDDDGKIVRAVRIPHSFAVPTPERFEHDARCWRDGVLGAMDALDARGLAPRGVSVSAMVPSLAPVDSRGVPIGPGLLYGDERGHAVDGTGEAGELARFLGWLAREFPGARGYWPAQAVANAALTGRGALSTTAAAACYPLFDFTGWNPDLVGAQGASVERLPDLVPAGQSIGLVDRFDGVDGCVVEGGMIDAMGEQIVAGADEPGDVLIICGTTLITWTVVGEPADVPGYFPIPHTTPGRYFIGGPSNAGGLFLDWANRMLVPDERALRPDSVPVWAPYPRGERVPVADPHRRAQLVDLDLTHGAGAVRRAAFEAAGFVARRMIEAAPVEPRRIVATGGGVRSPEWIQALADCTGLPVDIVRVPEGAALGTAWSARIAAGLEADLVSARRWASVDRRIEPAPAWVDGCAARYQRFLEIAG